MYLHYLEVRSADVSWVKNFSVHPRHVGGPYFDLPSKKVEQKNPEMQAKI